MLFSRIFTVLYFVIAIIGAISFFNSSSNQSKELTFSAVLIFSVIQNIYFNVKVNKLEDKLNEKN